jgi:hypothetical protein
MPRSKPRRLRPFAEYTLALRSNACWRLLRQLVIPASGVGHPRSWPLWWGSFVRVATGMKVIVLLAVALLLAAGMGGCRKPDTPNIGIVRGFLDGPNLPGAP